MAENQAQQKMDALSKVANHRMATPCHHPSQDIAANMEKFEKSTIIPMQKQAYLCAAKCCDKAANTQQLHACIQDCERSVHAAQNAANQHVGQFQQRLQRCTVRCQDEAQEALPSSPSEAQLHTARVRGAAVCVRYIRPHRRGWPSAWARVPTSTASLCQNSWLTFKRSPSRSYSNTKPRNGVKMT